MSAGDATPRLVLADWLREQDDPRGAWLRAAVAVSRDLPDADPGTSVVCRLRYTGQRGSFYPLDDLRNHGSNRAVRLLTALALQAGLRGRPLADSGRTTGALWRAAAAAELFACGLASEDVRQRVKGELQPGQPRPSRSPDRPHARICLVQAACLALRQWGCCNFALELLASSARRTPPGPATVPERMRDAGLMRRVVWRQLALAERLAIAVCRHPDWRHPAPRMRERLEQCHHDRGAAFQQRAFGWRCGQCGFFTDRAASESREQAEPNAAPDPARDVGSGSS